MTEISLNVLDIAQNSVKAKASLIEIEVEINTLQDFLTVIIKDNGTGMGERELMRVTDPFFTTRTTREVGLGVSLFKMSAEMTGGSFEITSKQGEGTCVKAKYILSSIDRMPLGDICATIETLMVYNTHIDFIYNYQIDGEGFSLSTLEMKEILDGVPLDTPDVAQYIRDYLGENTNAVNKGQIL
ncbi:MAG: ATP-binding protein [Oscillospiraceae bacterium]|nr:ATP-binding protein [Oscillospiraceae bacterium]